MRVIYNDFITEEMERIFNEEGTIFLSSDENAWLFTDMEVFNEVDKEFQFDIETDERESIYPIDLDTYLRNKYEDKYLNYFGFDICIADYSEIVLEAIENDWIDLYCENWDKNIDEYIKVAALDGLKFEMEETFIGMIDDGYDIDQFKDIVSNAMSIRDKK